MKHSFKIEIDEKEIIIINNKIAVCLDCLGLRFGYNIPNDDHNLTVLGAANELKCIVRVVK